MFTSNRLYNRVECNVTDSFGQVYKVHVPAWINLYALIPPIPILPTYPAMKLLHLLTPSLLATTALAGPWKFRRADSTPSGTGTSTSTSTSYPPAPTAPAGTPGQYCPSFGYTYRCSTSAECPSSQTCVSGPYLNGTDTANCSGQCYSPEPSTLRKSSLQLYKADDSVVSVPIG